MIAAMRGRRTVIVSSHILADVQRIADHIGILRDGRLLYPAFPYPNYTRVTRADSDAMFAFLDAESIDLFRIVHGEQRFSYSRPVVPGDVMQGSIAGLPTLDVRSSS